ncbi:hypothetical protein HAX54_031064 [Datura stramonium]|uniref:Uncharacterized protein n=1 Tax=Datura stramonium TaxID=4076 RepID=A0ABS8V9K0_DATST|nr:hypothetical protein [Datura stramonium]
MEKRGEKRLCVDSSNEVNRVVRKLYDEFSFEVSTSQPGVRKLKDDHLNLTQMMKDREVSIRQLEEIMNVLAANMESKESMLTHEPTKEESTLTSSNIDEDEVEWEVEESLHKETWEGILLNINDRGSEELEEECNLL